MWHKRQSDFNCWGMAFDDRAQLTDIVMKVTGENYHDEHHIVHKIIHDLWIRTLADLYNLTLGEAQYIIELLSADDVESSEEEEIINASGDWIVIT